MAISLIFTVLSSTPMLTKKCIPKIIRTVSILGILFLSFQSMQAQLKFEYGFSVGSMKYEGDVGSVKGSGFATYFNSASRSKPTGSIYLGYRPFEFITLRTSLTAGSIEAADALLSGTDPYTLAKKTRNIYFKSMIAEIGFGVEIYPTVLFDRSALDVTGKIRPYFTVGAAGFHFNPKGIYLNPFGSEKWVALKPLRTEGQGMPNHPDRKEYSLNQRSTPIGFGIKYYVSHRTSLSLELLYRATKTDYLDDVSTKYIDNNDFDTYFGAGTEMAQMAKQLANFPAYKNGGSYISGYGIDGLRGSPKYNDSYFTTSIKIMYRFGKNEGSENLIRSRKAAPDCPKNVFRYF